ncbi:WD-40 repeat-containing protein [Gloeothece citriformis PCC 7424]|uniref:WD-40 repeat-containing protein n=1 Tax=Gloeothece citriformis (strain PCC 7424) TaxID=65393 RepID=B7KBT4_GLOC7|nr:NB-ARC domain-containing protein [Gloeothece citriformis]ACK73062.1 WD-40 repeat-containing protein [Gloeothece citriformis PCC 7424]
MIKPQKQRRKRGVILSRSGFQKLQDATAQAQIRNNHGYRYTLEALGELTGLDPDTVLKVYGGKMGVDKRTLMRCFKAFNLKLETEDFCGVESKKMKEDSSNKSQYLGYHHWDQAPDVSRFYGRQAQLATLTDWILEDRCRIITILGIKGIGKTSLGVKLAQYLQDQFDYIIWRSLTESLCFKSLLLEFLPYFNQDHSLSSEKTSHLISLLLGYLRQWRCLVILDDVEAILPSDDSSRSFCQDTQGYGEFFQRLGETAHQSCLLLISHAKPKQVKLLEGEFLPVRVMYLKGLELSDAVAILQDKGCMCNHSLEEWHQIIQFYGGNPLLLKFLAPTIQNIFNGIAGDFLALNSPIFGEVQDFLEQLFQPLTQTQKLILIQIALNEQPLCLSQLREQILPSISPQNLIESLDYLQEISLIDFQDNFLSIAPFFRDYLMTQMGESKNPEIFLNRVSYSFHLPVTSVSS